MTHLLEERLEQVREVAAVHRVFGCGVRLAEQAAVAGV
jgi:hypothetical protein